MPDETPPYLPTTIAKVFELLDNKLVTFGIPGALSFVGITRVQQGDIAGAIGCFAGAVGVWLVIKVGKKLSPKLDNLLDWALGTAERSLLDGWSALRSDFEGQYLKQQARLCEEFTVEGFNPDRISIPLLEEVFVPLDLSGAVGVLTDRRELKRWQQDPTLTAEHLSIWKLLARSRRDRKFRQMSIRAKGGMGKTTLLRHVALIYGQRKQRRYRAPKLVPVLLRLRDWTEELTQTQPPSLPTLITDFHVPSLSKNHPLTAPPQWAEKLLLNGSALVMLDGFDELPEGDRPQVSHWISAQMREYDRSVFIVTSRPAGFKEYVAQQPTIPIFVNKFNPQQQAQFIHRWYLCQERCCRAEKQRRHAKEVAKERADNLIAQLQQRREELGYMAENPLLLNMLATFHRFDPSVELPRQRIDLYRGICKLQLEDRPKARLIRMLLSFDHNQTILQIVALAMVQSKRLKISHPSLLKFLSQNPILQQEEVDPAAWLKQMLEISELLVEREPGEYEFPHASFQGFFAATKLAQPQDIASITKSAQLVLQNWNHAIWRETVLLYTAQLNPKLLDQVIRKACEWGSAAADLATACLKEYPRPEKFSPDLMSLLQSLDMVAQDSKYQTLEALLIAQKWKEADYETYRLMITTVGKEENQWFDRADLENLPYDDLQTLDHLWVKYSSGKWGFSVQKRIWQECGSPTNYSSDWEKFGNRVGWYKDDDWVKYNNLTFNLLVSPAGEFPCFLIGGVFWAGGVWSCSSLLSRKDL